MLINRHYYNQTRWSLEQNGPVLLENETPSLLKRSILTWWWRRGKDRIKLTIIIGTITLFTLYLIVSLGKRFKLLMFQDDEYDNFLEVSEGKIFINQHEEHEAQGVLLPIEQGGGGGEGQQSKLASSSSSFVRKGQNYAFVTLLCDNSGIANAQVLTFALKRTKTTFPLIIMTLPFVSDDDSLNDLISLGAMVERVSMVPVPFKRRNGKRPSFDKMCKYSKIHAWSLTKYTKLTFLDTNLLVNIDELFQYPEFSAVKVVGDDFNTGMFVLEPSLKTYKLMLESYKRTPPNYLGEQGFLNWFFQNQTNTSGSGSGTNTDTNTTTNTNTKVISARYNTVLKQKDYAVWPLLRRNAKIFHFVPYNTPWNFYTKAHPEWELSFEPIIFFYWRQMYLQTLQTLQKEEFSPDVQWSNLRRTVDICSPQSTSYTVKKFIIQNKFSVLIGTWDRVSLLRKLILHYQKSKLVHKIYVTWHNPTVKPPEDFTKTLHRKPPVEILTQKYDSLNNRFNPIPNLETRGLLVCDDDIRVNITDIEYAFDVWKSRPYSLVGVFPRYHSFNSNNNTFNYEIRSPDRPRIYSIMLTKFMFINAEFLYIYTCLLPTPIHRYIDEHLNCEDIAMNLLVSGMTGSRPTAVMLNVDDFGTTSGISIKTNHLNSRSQCMNDLIKLFGKDTLKYNREVFLPFRKKKVAV